MMPMTPTRRALGSCTPYTESVLQARQRRELWDVEKQQAVHLVSEGGVRAGGNVMARRKRREGKSVDQPLPTSM